MIETYKIITGKYQGCVAPSLIKEEIKIKTAYQEPFFQSKNNQLMEQPASQSSQCKDGQWVQE